MLILTRGSRHFMVRKACNKKLEKLYIGQEAVAWSDNVNCLGRKSQYTPLVRRR